MQAWKEEAKESLQRNIEYYAAEDPKTAYRVMDEVITRSLALLDHQKMGRPGRVKNTRELVVNNTPFILVYAIKEQYIEIINVLHGAQQWPSKNKILFTTQIF